MWDIGGEVPETECINIDDIFNIEVKEENKIHASREKLDSLATFLACSLPSMLQWLEIHE